MDAERNQEVHLLTFEAHLGMLFILIKKIYHNTVKHSYGFFLHEATASRLKPRNSPEFSPPLLF